MRPVLKASLLLLLPLFAACGSGAEGEENAAPENESGIPSGPGASSDAGSGSDAEEPVQVPAHGFRSDWFDLFADKKATRFDVPATVMHDDATGPAKGIRGILYSARFSAALSVPQAGELSLIAKSDDGVRVILDGATVVDDWAKHPVAEKAGKVTVTAGPHELRVEYYQQRGAASLSLEWQPPGGTRAPIPLEALTPLATPPLDESGVESKGPRPTFANPVVPFDCPDPGIMSAPGPEHPRWVMVCTGGAMPIRVSDDLVSWKPSGNTILPGGKAAWSANGGRNWAPEIHKVGSSWVAYYTAVNGANRLSIGCAYATEAEGPYTDCGGPMVEHPQGVIDATFFEDTDGKRYLYYKVDGNSVGQATPMFVRELAANGRSFAPGSAQVQVLTNDPATFEGGVVEAPWIVKHGTFYYLFYSGNVYDSRYRMGVARGTSPKGPFTKKGGAPLMANNASWVGPGHGSVVTVQGKDLFFHHAWPALPNGQNDTSKGRFGLIAPIRWVDDWPVIGNGSSVVGLLPWP